MKFGEFKSSVATKISLAAVFLIIVAPVFLGIYFVNHHTAALNGNLEKLGLTIADNLAATSEWVVLSGDSNSGKNNLDNLFFKTKDLVYAEILDDKGVVLAASGRKYTGPSREFTSEITTPKMSFSEKEAGVVLSEQSPREKIGLVHLKFSLAEINSQIKRLHQISITVVAIVILVCLGIIFFAVKTVISKPLMQLMAGIRKIGSGDLSHHVEASSGDEIGDLAQAFNKMAADLKRTTVSRDYVDKIFMSMMDSLCVLSSDGVIKTANNAACLMVGKKEQDVVGKKCDFFIEDIKGKILREGKLNDYETQMRLPDDKIIPVLVSGAVVADAGGGDNIILTTSDISKLKMAQNALSAEKERLAVTLRSIADGVIAVDDHSNVVLVNAAVEKITGFSCEECLGRPISNIFYIKDGTICGGNDISLDSVIKNVEIIEHKSRILLTKSGEEKLIMDSIAPIGDKSSGIVGAVIVLHDITEKKRWEEYLKIQKLESLSLFAGGIAHDFNNMLTAIMANISLAKMSASVDSQLYRILLDAELASVRARDLTCQLLTFSKGGEPVKEARDISGVISETVQFLLSGSNIKSEFYIASGLWPVEVDLIQISQVLQNLTVNSMQAMPNGGVIFVSVENILIKEALGLPFAPGTKCIRITFKDQGEGIKAENLPKIFDPYFTTKKKGNGLGLAATYSIVKQHGGYMTVESQMGRGSTFCIYLPATDKPVLNMEEVKDKIHRGNAFILVMDDDPAVGSTISNILITLGYKVKVVDDGRKAVNLYIDARNFGRPFDLVILDLTVPGGIGGKEALEKIRQVNPGVKAIVSSGYSNDPTVANYREYGFCGVIRKPYNVEELSETLFIALNNLKPGV